MEIHVHDSPNTMAKTYEFNVSAEKERALGDAVLNEAVRIVAQQIAGDFLANHFSEIVAKITPEAIASMAIAEAGAAVNETLHRKLPDKILEIERVRTEVYQRGILGGLSKI